MCKCPPPPTPTTPSCPIHPALRSQRHVHEHKSFRTAHNRALPPYSYEKEHPLEVPKALLEQHQWALLKAIGVVEDKGGRGRRGLKFRESDRNADDDAPQDPPGSLGAALERLGEDLMGEINSIAVSNTRAARAAAGSDGAAAQGGRASPAKGVTRMPARSGATAAKPSALKK